MVEYKYVIELDFGKDQHACFMYQYGFNSRHWDIGSNWYTGIELVKHWWHP